MAYEPTNWQTGDLITAEKLNKLEEGVAGGSGGVFVVNKTEGENSSYVLDKTAGELFNAVQSNTVIMKYIVSDGDPTTTEISFLSYVSRYDDGSLYSFVFNYGEDAESYTAESADDYPIYY